MRLDDIDPHVINFCNRTNFEKARSRSKNHRIPSLSNQSSKAKYYQNINIKDKKDTFHKSSERNIPQIKAIFKNPRYIEAIQHIHITKKNASRKSSLNVVAAKT